MIVDSKSASHRINEFCIGTWVQPERRNILVGRRSWEVFDVHQGVTAEHRAGGVA